MTWALVGILLSLSVIFLAVGVVIWLRVMLQSSRDAEEAIEALRAIARLIDE